jgi:hypothetical protein
MEGKGGNDTLIVANEVKVRCLSLENSIEETEGRYMCQDSRYHRAGSNHRLRYDKFVIHRISAFDVLSLLLILKVKYKFVPVLSFN